jgi:hypothetical protein
MSSKKITVIVVIIAATAIASLLSASQANQTDNINPIIQAIPVTVRQIPPENGRILVQVKCRDVELVAPDSYETVPCVIQNNTEKAIRAVAAEFKVTTEYRGQQSQDSSYLTLETLLHPDLALAHRYKSIAPGAERALEPGPASYEGPLIKAVEVRMDYVEFEDGTTIGPNRKGSILVGFSRDGAAKYKEWLKRKYLESGNSTDAIASLLMVKDLPNEVGLTNPNQRTGARQYRNHIREIYATHGASELRKYFQ